MTQKKNSSVTCKKMTSVDGIFTPLTQSHDTGKMRMKVMANMMMIMVMVMMVMVMTMSTIPRLLTLVCSGSRSRAKGRSSPAWAADVFAR